MTDWRATSALVRAASTAALVALAALTLGRPDLLVLAAPFAVLGALGIAHAPRAPLTVDSALGNLWLHEGQSTRLRVRVAGQAGLEQVTVALTPERFVACRPRAGTVSATASAGAGLDLQIAVSPRRWGVRSVGRTSVGATSGWAGFRWGPASLHDHRFTALPTTSVFTSAENPLPVGLIGRNQSRRGGDGSEFYAIRPFQPGDRLRRVNWRTTLRTGALHSVGTNAQEDSAVLVVVDAVADVGASDGVDGSASSLDTTVRAANALAAHHIQVGDRVSLRVLGRTNLAIGPGAGVRHQRRIQELIARAEPGWPKTPMGHRLRFRAGAGTVVLVLSPMLTAEINTAMVTLARRGLTVVAVDTLTPDTLPATAAGRDSAGRLGWRLRMVEREILLTEVTRQGIPVVAWRGPGTLDEVLRRLSRRTRLPREVTR